MSVRTSRLPILSLVTVSLCALVLTGCGSRLECVDECTPRGPWQSPTIQAFRSLLLVNAGELDIEFLDAKKAKPSCIIRDEVREYYLQPGLHSIAARFNYCVPRSEGLLGEVESGMLTTEHEFQAGHAYVALYREHPYPKPAGNVGEVASNVRESDDKYYWTLEFVDLAEASLRNEPEVVDALLYCDWVKGVAKASN